LHRFVDDVVPGGTGHETKVCIGAETRNVLFAPYRSEPRATEVARDGTVLLGAVAEIDELSPEARGIKVRLLQLPEPTPGLPLEVKDPSIHYVPLERGKDASALAETRMRVLPAGKEGRTVQTWARELVPLPREYVTETVRIPRSARLDFGMGIEDAHTRPGSAAVHFTVLVKRGATRETLLSRTLHPGSAEDQPGWTDASLDLSGLAGTRVRFFFRTERVDGGDGSESESLVSWPGSPVWSSPILYSAEAPKRNDKPSILLISLDTVRADHLGCYGYHRATSPNIDKFVEDAFLFESVTAPSSWTLPSHASLFTGLLPSVHGADFFPWLPSRAIFPWTITVQERETTLTELARQCGLLTAAYTEGVYVRAALGFAQGFDLYSDGALGGVAEQTFGAALEWIRKYGMLPFFLFVHTYQPHSPYSPPGRFAAMFDPDYSGPVGKTVFGPAVDGFSDADKVHIEALYDGEIAYTDEVVGTFLDKLRQMHVLDNTVIIIFSDHGEEFYEHGGVGHNTTLYDEQLRVPLIIRLAGAHPPTGRVARQVSLTDVYATVVDILGTDHRSPTDCTSLLPLIGGAGVQTSYEREFVVSELFEYDKESLPEHLMTPTWRMRSVRSAREKYIISEKSQTEELYDLQKDPGEKNNIAAVSQADTSRYRQWLKSFLETVSAERTPYPPGEREVRPLTEEDVRRLKAIGYL
jgi:arylsulfatase A-like enzyme